MKEPQITRQQLQHVTATSWQQSLQQLVQQEIGPIIQEEMSSNTLQHTATHCNILLHPTTRFYDSK